MTIKIEIEGLNGEDARRQLLDLLGGQQSSNDAQQTARQAPWGVENEQPLLEADETPRTDETAEQATERKKRHRRTKVEMAAARAADDAGRATYTGLAVEQPNGMAGNYSAATVTLNDSAETNPHIVSWVDEVLAEDETLAEINADAQDKVAAFVATAAPAPIFPKAMSVGPFDHLDSDLKTGELTLTYEAAFAAFAAANKDATPATFNRSLLQQLTGKKGVGLDGAQELMASHKWTVASKIPETDRQAFFDAVQEKLRG